MKQVVADSCLGLYNLDFLVPNVSKNLSNVQNSSVQQGPGVVALISLCRLWKLEWLFWIHPRCSETAVRRGLIGANFMFPSQRTTEELRRSCARRQSSGRTLLFQWLLSPHSFPLCCLFVCLIEHTGHLFKFIQMTQKPRESAAVTDT